MTHKLLDQLLLCVLLLAMSTPARPAFAKARCFNTLDLLACLAQQREPANTTAPQSLFAPPGGFLTVVGDHLTRQGQTVLLKGVNYYPQWRPWGEMWRNWNGPQIARELRTAHNELGINSVRVLLPYNGTGAKDRHGNVTPKLLGRLRELAQIAGNLDMRLVVTLFDFYVDFEPPGTPGYERDLAYIRTLVGAFANDDRIAIWDVHNEPDHYGAWGDRQAEVLNWLGRMADEIHRVAPRQLVTVGMGQTQNLWQLGSDGRRPIDYSDVVSAHVYDPGPAATQLDELRTHTGKPLLVEEFGWPTDPQCQAPNYTEATQAQLYRDVVGLARERTSGVLAWTLRDYDYAPTMRWDSREEHYGLYRADGTLKPAADALRAYAAPPLPSATKTQFALTDMSGPLPNDRLAAIEVAGTPFTVKGMFRLAWEQMGGRTSFGLPLGDAFERQADGRVLQYFTHAVIELHDGARHDQDFGALADLEKIRRTLVLQPLGLPAAPMHTQQFTLDPALGSFYRQIDGPWRLGIATSAVRAETMLGVATRVQNFERGQLKWDEVTRTVALIAPGTATWQAVCSAVY